MKNIKVGSTLILIILISLGSGYGQIITFDTQEVADLWQGYTPQLFASQSGSPATLVNISSLGSSNPAGITSFDKLTFGVQYAIRSEIQHPLLESLKYLEDRKHVPQSAGMAMALGKTWLGLTYTKHFGYSTLLEGGEINSIEEPEGTGEYWEYGSQVSIDRYGFVVGRSIDMPRLGGALSSGVMISYDDIYKHSFIWNSEDTKATHNISGSMGAILDFQDRFRLGIYYTMGYQKYFVESNELSMNYGSSEFLYVASIPASFASGASITILPWLALSGNLDYTFWNEFHQQKHDVLNYSAFIKLSRWSQAKLAVGIVSFNIPEPVEENNLVYALDSPDYESFYPMVSLSIQATSHLGINLSATGELGESDLFYDRDMFSLSLEYTR